MDVQPNRISLQATMQLLLIMLAVLLLAACQPAEADLETEIAYLRLFAAEGKSEELADLLDNSMVLISAGEFNLGSQSGHRDEQPQRQIYLDAYEVTNAQYQRFVLAHDGRPPQHWQGTDYPAVQGDWPATGVS